MELRSSFALLLLAFALSGFQLSTCDVVNGKVSCLDCSSSYDFSGIKVAVKCDKVKTLAATFTDAEGSFAVELPSKTPAPLNCIAKLLGGPSQLYVSRQNMVSSVFKTHDYSTSSYTLSNALAFSTTCPMAGGRCGVPNEFGPSKTVDLPLPRDWGLAPSTYYVPFIPIFGIP